MALHNTANPGDSSANSASNSTQSSTSSASDGISASIEGESAPEPDIPRLRVVSASIHDDVSDDNSLRIPASREYAYGDANADGDDDGNVEDIESGDEYNEDDDAYDVLFDGEDRSLHHHLRNNKHKTAHLASASAYFAQEVGKGYSDEATIADEMDEVEKSFLKNTKPICSKKKLVSCLSNSSAVSYSSSAASRSTSPVPSPVTMITGPLSPLFLSDEDFPSLCGSETTAASSRRSSDGNHTPRVRFKKGCVITQVNLTWAPTTYDRAPIDVAESLDMHRCKSVEDAVGYAQDDDAEICVVRTPRLASLDDALYYDSASGEGSADESRGQWQAFSPGIYSLSSNEATSVSPTRVETKFEYVSTFGRARTPCASVPDDDEDVDINDDGEDGEDKDDEDEPGQSSGLKFTRSTVGYPLSRQSYETELSMISSSSSSSSEEEDDDESEGELDVIERCRVRESIRAAIAANATASNRAIAVDREYGNSTIYRPTARSPARHCSFVSSSATAETSLGAAARELSDSLDESSRSSSPAFSYTSSSSRRIHPSSSTSRSASSSSASESEACRREQEEDDDDCLSSTPKANGAGPLASAALASMHRQHDDYFYPSAGNSVVSFNSSNTATIQGFCGRQANLEANGTHDTSPPPQEEQPARKYQKRSISLEQRRAGFLGLNCGGSSSAALNRFNSSSTDIWESCEALGGF